jgi:hypothetical protein
MKKDKMVKGIIVTGLFFGLVGACSNDEDAVEEVAVEEVEKVAVDDTNAKEVVKEVAVEEVAVEEAKPKIGADVMAYGEHISTIMGDMSSTMFTFGDLMTNAGNNPSLIYDQEWMIDVAIQLNSLQMSIDKVNSLTAPTGFEDVHNGILKGMDEYQFVVDNLPLAIDNMDADLMNQCVIAMNNGGIHIEEASSLLETKL